MGTRLLWITPETLSVLMTDGRSFAIVADGLPDGTKMGRCGYDPQTDRLWFHVMHESWPETPRGEMIGSLPTPVIKTLS
jgi:hypothetical protein